jgi:hypothetical protein
VLKEAGYQRVYWGDDTSGRVRVGNRKVYVFRMAAVDDLKAVLWAQGQHKK